MIVWVRHFRGSLLTVWCVFVSLLSVVNDAYHAELIAIQCVSVVLASLFSNTPAQNGMR